MKKDARSAIVAQMHKRLDRAFGGEAWDQTRTPSEPLDNLMRTILSQNTTDENRDRAFDALKKKYPTWEQVMNAPIEDVKTAIKVAGLANQKGPAMQGFLTWLWQEKGNLSLDFLQKMDEDDAVVLLTKHKGIGIKTAYIVLAFACNKDLCAVDTHVHRIVKRVGLIDETCGREKAHRELRPLIPKGKARAFHVNLLDLGKTICHARGPNCGACMILDLCVYGKAREDR
jgi:endonuclease-3